MGDEEEVAPPRLALPPASRFYDRSWHLKVLRAEDHLHEFKRALAEYGDRRPYSAERRLERKSDHHIWHFVLKAEENPDPKLAMILGDFMHNIRAALDHLACACVPKDKRKSAGFPVTTKNLWERRGWRFVHRKRNDVQDRAGFGRRIKHMPREARAVVHALQPYNRDIPAFHTLYMVNRLDNFDKHRSLILTNVSLHDIRAVLNVFESPTSTMFVKVPVIRRDCKNGADLFAAEPPEGHTLDSKVQVEIDGTPRITVDLRSHRERAEVTDIMHATIAHLWMTVFPSLEPFVVD